MIIYLVIKNTYTYQVDEVVPSTDIVKAFAYLRYAKAYIETIEAYDRDSYEIVPIELENFYA